MQNEFPTLVSKIIAVAYTFTGIAMIKGSLDFKKMFKELESYIMLTTLMGVLTTLLGMLILTHHNVWVNDWTVMITLIGWALLFEGFFYLVFPKELIKFFKRRPWSSSIWGVFTLGLGIVFGYFGFFL